jgi:hypothetical protein
MLNLIFKGVEQDRSTAAAEISLADVLCLVYSVSDDRSFSRLESYWIPLIRKASGTKMVDSFVLYNGY